MVGEAIDQIEVDAAHAGGAQPDRRRRGLLDALNTIDRFLHLWVEALDAKACAVDSGQSQRRGHCFSQSSGINLDGDFGVCLDVEMVAQQFENAGEFLRRHDGRRSSAKMHMPHSKRVR